MRCLPFFIKINAMAKTKAPKDTTTYKALSRSTGKTSFPEPIGTVRLATATQEQLQSIYEHGFIAHVEKLTNEQPDTLTDSDTGAGAGDIQ